MKKNTFKHQKNQYLCQCGEEILRSDVILLKAKSCANCRRKESELKTQILEVVTTPRRAVRPFRCLCCEKSFGIQKMSACLIVCRRCNSSIHEKGKSAKNRLIGKVAANFGRFLQLTGGHRV